MICLAGDRGISVQTKTTIGNDVPAALHNRKTNNSSKPQEAAETATADCRIIGTGPTVFKRFLYQFTTGQNRWKTCNWPSIIWEWQYLRETSFALLEIGMLFSAPSSKAMKSACETTVVNMKLQVSTCDVLLYVWYKNVCSACRVHTHTH